MRIRRILAHRLSPALTSAMLALAGGMSAPAQVPGSLSAAIAVAMVGNLASTSVSAATTTPNQVVELSPTPPGVTQAVPPNIVVTFDDSGSMANNYMGDNRPFDGGSWTGPWRCAGVIDPRVTSANNVLSKAMNGVYYNPNVVYSPPVKADGSLFPNADETLAGVWLDGIGINRPYSPVTADTESGYRNNPNGTTDPTGLTDLTGTFTYKTTVTYFATFGTTCAANADSGSCQTNSSDTSSGGTHRFWTRNVDATSGSGIATVYSGTSLRVRDSNSSGYSRRDGDKTSATGSYATWTVSVTDTSQIASDNRWKCGYGSSPMDGTTADSDGNIYPIGGPYYYRYKSTAPTITVDAFGNPDSAGRTNLYTSGNWEAVAVPNTTITINGRSVNQWQNFANWYAYYRTRNLMTQTSISRVFGALGAATDTGGFGNAIRVAWQNLNDGDYKLPDNAIITSLIDAAGCDASDVDPQTTQQAGKLKTAPNCYRSAFFNWIFQVGGNSATPNRAATIRAGNFFKRGSGNTGGSGDLTDPYWDPPKVSGADGLELVCRQNFHMLVTDGYWNETNNYTVSGLKKATTGTTLPDTTTYSVSAAESRVFWDVQGTSQYTPSLADIAFNYWATDLRTDLANTVPPYLPDNTTDTVPNATSGDLEKYFNPKNDPASWQHVVQYMVTLGVPGKLSASDDADCDDANNDLCKLRKGQQNSSGQTGWPAPKNNDPTGIDDTWHAAINSRGAYFNAGNPQNLVDQLTNILTNISARNAPAITGAVNTSVLVPGALGFSTGYSSADWSGTLQAVGVKSDGSLDATSLWDAGAKLDAESPGDRSIFTSKQGSDGTFSGIDFSDFTDLDETAQALLRDEPPSTDTTNDTGQARLNYLRGVRSLEGTIFRPRAHVLGAIIGSQALFVSYPSSGYRNTWPEGSPEQKAVESDEATCADTTPSTCHSYEHFVQDNLARKPTVYVGANDGMMHAFDASMYEDTSTEPSTTKPTTTAGSELFAYVPRSVYANLGDLTSKSNFHFMPTVDGELATRDVFFSQNTTTPVKTSKGWHTLLVGALRLGGRGIYALDVTDPTAMTAEKVLWEFNADQPDQAAWTDDAKTNPGGKPSDLGYTYGQPNIGRLPNGKWVVLVAGGYFPDCSKAPFTSSNCSYPDAAKYKYSSLFILDAQTGKLIRQISTPDPATISGAVASHGLATPVLGDYNDDQIDDVAFAGDLDGNLWRFDLSSASPADWSVRLVFQPATPGNQPITSMPRLFADPVTNRFMVVFGTGKYLGANDNTSDSAPTQAVYGIRDNKADGAWTVTNLVQQTLSEKLADDGITLARGLTDYPVASDKGGWYFNLGPSASSKGERVVVTPGALFDTGRVVIQTLIPGTNDPCSASIQGAIMVLNAATGGSSGGLARPSVSGWGGSGPGNTSVVGGRVNNPRTNGSVPLVTTLGGGNVLIPGLKLTSGSVLNINDAVWRRRSWRSINNQ